MEKFPRDREKIDFERIFGWKLYFVVACDKANTEKIPFYVNYVCFCSLGNWDYHRQ